MKLQLLLLLNLIIFTNQATYGVDLAGLTDQFPCMKNYNKNFAITRGYRSLGVVDTNGRENLKRIRDADMAGDVYFFPCAGKSPITQVQEFVEFYDTQTVDVTKYQFNIQLESTETKGLNAGIKEEIINYKIITDELPQSWYKPIVNADSLYSTVWIDVEDNPSPGCGWDVHTYAENCQFLQDLVNSLKEKGKKVGIYASRYMWPRIFGGIQSCALFTDLPVWYAHYDSDPSFNDWSANQFGGWTVPAIKQYSGSGLVCGVSVDLNFY